MLGISQTPGAPRSDAATIVDSGSTNRPGFRISVTPSGAAECTSKPRPSGDRQQEAKPVRRTIPPGEAKRFFADLNASQPLGSLPAVHCMKSASFGARLTVSFGAEETPDLSCGDGGNARMRDLIRDVNAIVAVFGVR